MPPFNGRQIQQQLRAFLVFIQLQIIMYFQFLRRAQQPPPPAPIQRPRRRHVGQAMATAERGEGGLPQHYG